MARMRSASSGLCSSMLNGPRTWPKVLSTPSTTAWCSEGTSDFPVMGATLGMGWSSCADVAVLGPRSSSVLGPRSRSQASGGCLAVARSSAARETWQQLRGGLLGLRHLVAAGEPERQVLAACVDPPLEPLGAALDRPGVRGLARHDRARRRGVVGLEEAL